jgi:hypothetical protein
VPPIARPIKTADEDPNSSQGIGVLHEHAPTLPGSSNKSAVISVIVNAIRLVMALYLKQVFGVDLF